MNRQLVLLLSFGGLALFAQTALAAQMRSRAEAVPGMQASNTVGLGDIWVTGGLSSFFRIRPVANELLARQVDTVYRDDFRQLYGSGNRLQRELVTAPELGGIIGLANFLHLEVSGVPWDGEKLGATTARLHLTLPGNDNQRVIGLGVSLNATLSTEEDIYARGATTPGFEPLLFLTVMADVDWIKVAPTLPLKLYVNYANLDDYRLAHAYAQHRIAIAGEYKGYRKGCWARVSAQLYRPLATRFDPDPGHAFLAPFYELGIGYRTMLGNRLSFTAEASLDPIHPVSFYSREASKPPRLSVGFQAPLVYNETRAEAIRALIFNEEARKRLRATAAGNLVPKAAAKDSAAGTDSLRLDEISLEERKPATQSKDMLQGVLDDDETKAIEKRKQIRGELKQIEDLLQ